MERNAYRMAAIETIVGVSSGSLLAIVLLLGYEWDDLEKYFIGGRGKKSLGVQMVQAMAKGLQV